MLELFRTIPPGSTGIMTPPTWAFVQRGLAVNTAKVQDYYRQWVRPVRSNHFLVRLLQMVNVPKSLPTERYYANVDAVALNLSMAMRMTSTYYKGSIHRGIFYGPTTPEILLATDDRFDFEAVHANWQTVAAVTPLLHAKSDLDLHVPTGQATSREDGLSVILVNIPMLAVQYRAFVLDQLRRNPDNPKGIQYFIGAYVLPNMLPMHLELCLFNRLYDAQVFPTKPKPAVQVRHPFALSDYTSAADHALGKALEYITKGSLNFNTVLKTLPSVLYPNLYHALVLPDIAPNRQVDWLLVLTRLKAVDFLFKTCQSRLLSKNQMQVNQILRAFRVNDVYSAFKENLPSDLFFEAQDYLDDMLSAAERTTF